MSDNWGHSHHMRSGGILESCDRLGNMVRKGDSKMRTKNSWENFLRNIRSDERRRDGKIC